MFLQIVNTDSIGTIANLNNSNEKVLFIIVIIGATILLYLLFRPIKTKTIESSVIKKQPKTEANETYVEKEVTSLNPVEVSNIIISKSATSIIEKPITEIIKEPQPIIEETITEVVVVEEEQTKEKYIGYNPINIFAQTEPLYFPYVMMPKPNCVIKFPRKGRTGRKGFKEEAFKEYIDKYFKSNYQVYDDRFVLVANNTKPYEPDFTLINEKNDINIFVDIEIDEPYEGINDIQNRKPTHCKYNDTDRNNAFTNRGWIVIRFAEIQVHQQPDACCKFIAHLLKSIDPQFSIPESLLNEDKIQPLLQWTEEEAKQWSLEKYREHYLGIDSFGSTANNIAILDFEETELEKAIEELVEDEVIEDDNIDKKARVLGNIYAAYYLNKFIKISTSNLKTVIKTEITDFEKIKGFCYVKNNSIEISVNDIEDVEVVDNYYLLQYHNEEGTSDTITEIINNAIEQNKTIRIVYTKPGWVDYITGEIIEAEESVRTLTDIGLSINILPVEHITAYSLDENYVSGFCNTKNEIRTFKFNRISKIEFLNI